MANYLTAFVGGTTPEPEEEGQTVAAIQRAWFAKIGAPGGGELGRGGGITHRVASEPPAAE